MNSILRIVNYLLKTKNIIRNECDLDRFFDNGVNFPQFVSFCFRVDQIPGICPKPKNKEQQNSNNKIALEYLFQNNQLIAAKSPNFFTKSDKFNLIKLILKKQYFKNEIKKEKIVMKCNLIVQTIGLHYNNINEIIKVETLIKLLHVLTDGKVKIDEKIKDFDSSMNKIFTKAKVPFVIDSSALEHSNNFLFRIQILIILDHFPQKIKQIEYQLSKSDDQQKSNENDELNNAVLLKTINGILKDGYFYFKNITDATRGKNAYEFVKLFFKDDPEFFEQLNNSKKDIESIINLLGKKEPIFNILLFNFKDEKYEFSSSVLFYTTFLNCFFLKKTKEQLFERCSTIIFSMTKRDDFFFDKLKDNIISRKNPYDDKSLLFMWDTYLALVHFVNKRNVHYKRHILQKNFDNCFEEKKIPQVIDEFFIKNCNYQEKNGLYYQLQFIFNALDNESFIFHFCEMILNTIRLVKNVKVPEYSTLAENIRVKNVSLILQKNIYNQLFVNEKNNEKYKKLEIEELNMLKKEKIKLPETFEQRYIKNKKIKIIDDEQSLISFQSAETYWNSDDNNYLIENGILFKKNKIIDESMKEWTDNIKNFEKFAEKNFETVSLFSSFIKMNETAKYYKFFVYNEDLSKWEIDPSSFSYFFTQKYIKKAKSIPLVFFSNSYENEVFEIISKLINYSSFNSDDDHIYVYGLSGKSLFEYDAILPREQFEINLLFVHVPKSKQNIKNIKSIIFKIQIILSIICDIEVVILNKEHYYDQIEFLNSVNNIKNSYQKIVDLNDENTESIYSSDQLNSDDLSSDGDDGLDIIIEENSLSKQHYLNNNLMKNINLDLFKKHTNHILLINDNSIQGDIINIKENTFLSNIRDQITSKFCEVCYINVNDAITYRSFLSNLNKLCFKINKVGEDLMKYFELINIINVSSMYINIKSKNDWKTGLRAVIENRFEQYKSSFTKSDSLNIIYRLYEEIISYFPSIDIDFSKECNLILDDIKIKETQLKNEFMVSELKTSSENNLNYLKEVINSKINWTNENEDSIINSHINFLEKEFYSIMTEFFSEKDYQIILSCCQSILKNQIDNDIEAIKNFFSKQKAHEKEQIIDMLDKINERTNVCIRESERLKEIKVICETGHLVEKIEQDF